MPTPSDIANFLSILALIVSVFAMVVSWLAYKRDEGRLRATVVFEMEGYSGTAFQVTLANHGRRLVRVNSVEVCIKRSRWFALGRREAWHFPLDINEAESRTVAFSLTHYLDVLDGPLDVTDFRVSDSLGKQTVISAKHLRRQIQEEWTPETDWITPKKAARSQK